MPAGFKNPVSGKQKWPRAEVLAVAEELQALFAPACERIAIVGSVRRGLDFCSDVELLFVSRLSERPDGLFDSRIVNVAAEVCDKLLADGVLAKRPNKNGHFAWGEANKLSVHVASGIPVDLFSCPPQNYWVSLVIRTGSKETNLRLTNGAIERGGRLNAYGSGVSWKDGTHTEAKSEQGVFALCGIKYLEPCDR